jgi:hypothetical protein
MVRCSPKESAKKIAVLTFPTIVKKPRARASCDAWQQGLQKRQNFITAE